MPNQNKPKYLQQSSIWKSKTSTSNHLKDLKIPTQQIMFWNCLFRYKYNLLKQKVAVILGYFVSSKNHNESQKVVQWKGINRKHSTRWQHLSCLKARAFFSLQKNLLLWNTATYTWDWDCHLVGDKASLANNRPIWSPWLWAVCLNAVLWSIRKQENASEMPGPSEN